MNFNKPKREGYMLTLWNKLIPDKGYTRLEIETLIQQANLPSSTFSNFRDYGVKQGYAILDDKTDLYYRSDSVLPSQEPQISEDEMNDMAQFIQKTLEELKLAKQSQQNITQEKQLVKQQIQQLEMVKQQMQQLEIQEAELATKIKQLELNLEPLRSIVRQPPKT